MLELGKVTADDPKMTLIENSLLGPNAHFNNQHLDFINNWSSITVQACPGSGKTTSLLAKIMLLEDTLPRSDNSGVLVLSHTNIAVDEIKRRLGSDAKVFSYPNFVGTIQEFTDKFLALPYAKSHLGWNISAIDDDLYIEKLLSKTKAFMWSDNYGKLGSYFMGQYMKQTEKLTNSKQEAIDLAIKMGEKRLIDYYIDFEDNCIKQYPFSKVILKDPTKPVYKGIKKLMEAVHADGTMSYRHAYLLAMEYVANCPKITQLLQARFKYIFVDEMQDMNFLQQKLINILFRNSSSVVQLIGDINQSIYDDQNIEGDNNDWLSGTGTSTLTLDGTVRLSQLTANAVKGLGVIPQNLTALVNRSQIRPKIIIFDDDSINGVIHTFAKIVFENNLHLISESSNNPIRAVGWRAFPGDDKNTLAISKYHPTYEKKQVNSRVRLTFEEYLEGAYILRGKGSVVSGLLITSVLELLKVANIKDDNNRYYNKTTFLKHVADISADGLSELEEAINRFNRLLSSGDLNGANNIWRVYINNRLKHAVGVEIDTSIPSIGEYFKPINHTAEELPAIPDAIPILGQSIINKYYYMDNNQRSFAVDISTVHAAKGETHTATLYLDTYCYKKNDSGRILSLLIGDRSNAKNSQTITNMRVAYVGMTRPTHMLCYAVHINDINDSQLDLLKIDWDIEYVG